MFGDARPEWVKSTIKKECNKDGDNISCYCLYSIYHYTTSASACLLSLRRLMQAMSNQQ